MLLYSLKENQSSLVLELPVFYVWWDFLWTIFHNKSFSKEYLKEAISKNFSNSTSPGMTVVFKNSQVIFNSQLRNGLTSAHLKMTIIRTWGV